jgi:alpha-beta hydrolase superfamily lysophospholipase
VQNFSINSLSDGLKLHGYRWSVENPVAAMSLVHGLAEHCGRYDNLAQYLNRNGIDVIGVDLRGHGQSAGPRGVAKRYADIAGDVSTLVQETRSQYPGLPRFLFGHSLGGGLVLHHGMTAVDDALSGYLVSAPLIHPGKPVSGVTRGLVKLLRKIAPKGTLPIPVSGKKISTIPEEQDRYDKDPLRHRRMGIGLAVDMIENGEELFDTADQWDKPLRMWHSRSDRITSFDASEHFSKHAQNCEFTAFDEVRHEMHQDLSRDEVHALVVKFIHGNLQPRT